MERRLRAHITPGRGCPSIYGGSHLFLHTRSLLRSSLIIQPWTTYPAAAGIEDAVVLGALFSHLSGAQQIKTLLNAYQEIRQTRCKELVQIDSSNISLLLLPPGPEQDARNVALAQMEQQPEQDSDSAAMKELDGLIKTFGYEAEDAAEVRLLSGQDGIGKISQSAHSFIGVVGELGSICSTFSGSLTVGLGKM